MQSPNSIMYVCLYTILTYVSVGTYIHGNNSTRWQCHLAWNFPNTVHRNLQGVINMKVLIPFGNQDLNLSEFIGSLQDIHSTIHNYCSNIFVLLTQQTQLLSRYLPDFFLFFKNSYSVHFNLNY